MVDYSKWDKLEVGSSDDEADAARCRLPVVTKLDKPTRVVIPARGILPTEEASSSTSSSDDVVSEPASEPVSEPCADRADRQTDVVKPAILPCEGSDDLEVARGAREDGFLWSQSTASVVLRVPIPASVRAKDVKVQLSRDGRLVVTVSSRTVLDRELWHDVWGAVRKNVKELGMHADAEEERELHWELLDLPGRFHRQSARDIERWGENASLTRCVCIELTKFVPALMRTIWWERAFAGGEEHSVDTAQFSRSAPFRRAFHDAQREFRAKILAQSAGQRKANLELNEANLGLEHGGPGP